MNATKKPKKRSVHRRTARALLAVAASLTLGSLAATGCGDAIEEPDAGFISNPVRRDMAHPDMAGRD